MAIVTDELRTYQDAILKEFYTMKSSRTRHLRVPNIRNRSNNNMIERLHGTIRSRNKTIRGLKTKPTAETMIEGYRVYCNFIRPHMALNGKTPAEKANVSLQLQGNKWLDLMKKIHKLN